MAINFYWKTDVFRYYPELLTDRSGSVTDWIKTVNIAANEVADISDLKRGPYPYVAFKPSNEEFRAGIILDIITWLGINLHQTDYHIGAKNTIFFTHDSDAVAVKLAFSHVGK